jgi:hypothetical protein
MQGAVEDVIQNSFLAFRSLEDKKNTDTFSESIEQQSTGIERVSAKSGAGLILAEEMEIGHVSWNARKYNEMIPSPLGPD